MDGDKILLGLLGSLILIGLVKELVDNHSSVIQYLRNCFGDHINSEGYFEEEDSDESSDSE